jgi:hydrogenase expression/formation protein HypE
VTSDPSLFGTGKLPLEFLHALLAKYTQTDDRLVAGPRVGEDVAVVDMGDRYMVVKTDPITFATDQIGWYAVHVNANDVATSGARPKWMLNTVLLPEKHTTPALVEEIFSQLHRACESLGITLVGGHTEVAWGLERPIVVGVLIGEVARDKLLLTSDARVGDHVLLVKGIPIEGTAIIARERYDELRGRGYSQEMLDRACGYLFDPGISVVEAAYLAAEHPGVHAMHDPTEGGLATGLHELAFAAEAGVRLWLDRVPILPEGVLLCREYGMDPLGVIASGALLVSVDAEHSAFLQQRYREANVPCAHIADLVPAEQGITMVDSEGERPLPRYDADEITRLF